MRLQRILVGRLSTPGTGLIIGILGALFNKRDIILIMRNSERLSLIIRNSEEVLTRQDLASLVDKGKTLKHYIGFEISGKIHLGTGLMCMSKVKDFMEAGVDTNILLADWHTWINEKLSGDLKTIQEVAVGYFTEGLKASLLCLGGDPKKLKFVLGSELYHNNDEYWRLLIEVAKHSTLSRIKRSVTILGRQMGEAIDFAKLIYPVMQVADIFIQNVNIAHAGSDQRKAHVIARHVGPLIPAGYKPVAIHHHLILGLGKPSVWPIPKGKRKQDLWESMKMSKSKPKTAIFIHDKPDEIREKIMDAFCPPQIVEFNPIMDWAKHLVFREGKSELRIKRQAKYGGLVRFSTYAELEEAYKKGGLHPEDLKVGMSEWLINFLEPARKHFAEPKPKEMLARLEKLV